MAEQDMGRSDIGIREDSGQSKVFAELASSTDREEDVNFGDGFTDDYNSTLYPTRKDFNSALSYATAVVADVNQYGATLPWDSTISYKAGATVVRWDSSAGKARMFYCLVDNNNTDPLNNPTIWQDFRDFLEITSTPLGMEYKEIVDYDKDASALSGGGNTTRVYDISLFNTGSNNGLITENIRMIYLHAESSGDKNKATYVSVTMPSKPDEFNIFFSLYNIEHKSYGQMSGFFPVAKNDTFKIRSECEDKETYASWKILGAMQIVN